MTPSGVANGVLRKLSTHVRRLVLFGRGVAWMSLCWEAVERRR